MHGSAMYSRSRRSCADSIGLRCGPAVFQVNHDCAQVQAIAYWASFRLNILRSLAFACSKVRRRGSDKFLPALLM